VPLYIPTAEIAASLVIGEKRRDPHIDGTFSNPSSFDKPNQIWLSARDHLFKIMELCLIKNEDTANSRSDMRAASKDRDVIVKP
jgi:hypothetical protein